MTVLGAAVIGVLFVHTASAYRFSSTSYTIDASVANGFGGQNSSSSYSLISSGGENVIGNGTGGTYKLGMGYVAQLPYSLQLTFQPSGLAGYWPFEEPSGTATYDQSAAANQATLTTQTFTTGKIGGGLLLTGTAASATVVNSTAYDFQSSDFTVEYWHKPSSGATAQDIMGKWEAGVGGFAVTYANGVPLMFLNNINVYRYCTATTVGVWSHIAFVKSGTSLNCYVNGVLANGAASGTPPANIGSTTQPFKFGVSRYGTAVADPIDEVKLYTRALTANELVVAYNAGMAGTMGGVSLGTILPGVSNSVTADAIVQTDASGYSLAINQNQNLTSGSYTIPAVSGSIAAPASWTEGTTKGLGFTLTATNATAIPGIWNSGNSYAAFPGTATTFYTRTGKPTAADYLTLKLRADVPTTQIATTTPYSNTLTLTGTITP